MKSWQRVMMGCFLTPVVLVASCVGKMAFDSWRYELPGKVLASETEPTRKLSTSMDVADALDAYVQPRFSILRDKNFGAFRIVYRKHAGVGQLKVESPKEHEQIANVNAANRDYAIGLLHCSPHPESRYNYSEHPKLELLYINQQKLMSDLQYGPRVPIADALERAGLDWESVQDNAIVALPKLRKGNEARVSGADWDVLMRPVTAREAACVDCHEGQKPGAVLGVMVYAVRKTTRGAAQSASIR